MANTFKDNIAGETALIAAADGIYLTPTMWIKDNELKVDAIAEFTGSAGVSFGSTVHLQALRIASTAVTATTGGGTTGLIPATSSFVTVTSDSADKQISLPAVSIGHKLTILVGATGCELISAVAAHKVNDVTVGATNEAALTATNMYECKYVATNTWVVVGYTKLGAVQAALVPDSL